MQPKPEHEAYYRDLCDALRKGGANLDALEILAITANFLGKLIAMQDQRKLTPEAAMRIVARNIEIGNKQVLDDLMNTKGNG